MKEQQTLIKTATDVCLPEGVQLHMQKLQWPNSAAVEQPTLVFLHDSLGCITLWRDFPEQLASASGLNTLVYDRQGYGQSAPFDTPRTPAYLEEQAHVLATLLQQLEITKAVLFGHSDGGSIALVAAAAYPQLVKAVITVGAHVFVEAITLAGIREAKNAYATTQLEERLARYHGDKTTAMFAAWTETWLSPEFRNWTIEKYLPGIQCPVLVIQGEQDEYGTEAQVDAIVQQVGGKAQKCILPGLGHTPYKEQPETVITTTVAFLKDQGVL